MVTIEDWKFLVEREIKDYAHKTIKVYDGHYDIERDLEAFVIEVNKHAYLCAIEHYNNTVYPVLERNGRLELCNYQIIGKIQSSVFEPTAFSNADELKIYWNPFKGKTDKVEDIETAIRENLNSGSYNKVSCLGL